MTRDKKMGKVKLLCSPKTMEVGQVRCGFEFWLRHFLALYLGQVPSTLCASVASSVKNHCSDLLAE